MLEKKYLPDPNNIFLIELSTFKYFNSHGCISSRTTSQLLHLMFPLPYKYHYREQRVCARLSPFSMASKVTVSILPQRGKGLEKARLGYTRHVHFLPPNHSSSTMSRRAKGAQVNKAVLKSYSEFHVRRLPWYFASNNLQRENAISLYFKE